MLNEFFKHDSCSHCKESVLDYSLKHLAKPAPPSDTKAGDFDPNAKHENMLRAIAPFAKEKTVQNAESGSTAYITKKTKLLLIILPEWSPYFPPFNLARLSAVSKQAGYQTKIMDVNVRAYNLYLHDWRPNGKIDHALWNATTSWKWVGKDNYMNNIHPLMEPLFLQVIEEIVAYGPDIIGFTEYYINQEPTNWMAQELKKRMPNLKIALGGSNIHNGSHVDMPYYDYIVTGEGEEAIIKILTEIEEGKTPGTSVRIKQEEEQRMNLNDFPVPDYTGIDFNEYQMPNGVNSEFSRGCIAKCTFCEETHFYKYRQRTHMDVIREIEYLNKEKGTDVIWFVDSLVNGNLKELRSFCKELIARDLKVKWTGYCRCDGRMDRAFYEDLAASGCIMLNYGIESGSEKVLKDMNKGVTTAEMEQNFRDGKATGVWAATNWIVGFPTEEHQHFAETMTFLWRNRNMNINNIGAGVGFGLGKETIVGQNFDRFNLLDHKYMNHWITKDFKKGGPHNMSRVKSFNILLEQLLSVNPVNFPRRENLIKEHYKISYFDPSVQNEIDFEEFDFNIIKPNINPFADALVNELWPLFRTLWRTRGGFRIKVLFNGDIDLKEFGSQYGPGNYIGEYKFLISPEGYWTADFKAEFKQEGTIYPDDPDRNGPFRFQEYSDLKSSTAIRARRFAKPAWGEEGRSHEGFMAALKHEKMLNETIDFSFKLHWKGDGKWTASKPLNKAQESTSSNNATEA